MAAKRKQWNDVSMAAAVDQIQQQGLSLRESSRLYNVPLETLRRRVNGTLAIDCRPGPRTVLTEEEETKLADYLLQMSEMGYGLTREGVMGLAYSIVEKSKRPHPFQNGSAGRAWFEGFMRRRPNLTIRSPQSLSYCRAISANKETITDFFGKIGARENNVCLLCLPAHTSHILQPLDVGVFKSFKSSFNKACGNYMKQNPGRVITTDVLASMVGQAYPTAFTPVNIFSGFKKTGIYPFNPSAVDDRQLAPSTALLKKATPTSAATLSEQPLPEDESSDGQPMLFSPEKEKRFARQFEEGYDILDDMEYVAWVRINHPERCFSVGSSSSVSASSHANHVSPVTNTSSNPNSEDHPSENDVLSDILVLPKPKEKSGQKRKAGINQKTVCVTDDDVFDGLKAKDKEKKDNELKKLERKKFQEEKKAKKEKLKKEKEEKKKQKELAKQAKKAGEGPEELERMLSGLALDGDESDDAVCPNCGLLYSAGEENLWVCCDKCFSWYDFKCTKLRSKRHLPDSYICDSCK